MRVIATTLCLGVSILLTEEIDGWRFVSWSVQRGLDQEPMPEPGEATRRRFASAEQALAYFREVSPAQESSVFEPSVSRRVATRASPSRLARRASG